MTATTVGRWPDVSYERWAATCDTLHAHAQVLGKLAAELAPPEPQLQHAVLRLTVRGWETAALPAPNGSGALAVVLDLRLHEITVEHSGGWTERIPLTPHRPVGHVTHEVLAAVARLGGPVPFNPAPQEVPWRVPLDEDSEHAWYEPEHVRDYFSAATRAVQVLTEFRAPFRGRSTAVSAWWGAFDVAVSLFSGRPSDPPATTSSRATRPTHRPWSSGGGPATSGTQESLLRLRPSGRGGPFAGRRVPSEGPLGPRLGGIHPRLGRRVRHSRSPRRRTAVRPFGPPPCQCAGRVDEALAASVDGRPPPLRPRPDRGVNGRPGHP